MVGGGGVQGRYGEVGISMRGMVRPRRVAASSWTGVSCARVSRARMLFSARVDGIGPSSSSAEFSLWFFGYDNGCGSWAVCCLPWGCASRTFR